MRSESEGGGIRNVLPELGNIHWPRVMPGPLIIARIEGAPISRAGTTALETRSLIRTNLRAASILNVPIDSETAHAVSPSISA